MPLRRRGGLVRTAVRTAAIAGTASAVAGRVNHHQQEKWAAQDQEQYEQQMAAQQQYAQNPPPPAAAPAAEDATTAKIQQLAELHAQGALTDEEFAAAKAKALGI
jgi:hypothetical protein